jgi:hypothetical protein
LQELQPAPFVHNALIQTGSAIGAAMEMLQRTSWLVYRCSDSDAAARSGGGMAGRAAME